MPLRRSISIAVLVCLAAAPALAQVSYPDFSDTSALTLNGAAAAVNNGIDPDPVLRLTPANFSLAGTAFTSGQVCVSGFSSLFRVRITNSGPASPDGLGQFGADGLTLILHSGSPAALGGSGGGLGYFGMRRSVAVELDTWFNGLAVDPDSNHVGIDVNGSFDSVVAQPVAGQFNDGTVWSVWVDYNGAVLEVRVSNTGVRPAAPTTSLAIDIPATLGSPLGVVGFGAGTGAAYNNHDVLSWTFAERCGSLVIDGCDSRVTDYRLPDGSLFSQRVQACATDATTHGEFVSCVAALGNEAVRTGAITGRQKGAIQSCSGRASYHTGPIQTGEFIVNGGFETGDATGWILTASGGVWTVNSGTLDPLGPATPQAPIDGAFDLVSHQGFVNLNRAAQALTVPLEVHAATLSWSDRVQSFAPLFDPGQEYRVVIRDASGTATLAEVFSTNAGDAAIQNGPNARSVDLTAALQALKGQNVVISFEQQAQASYFTLTLDQVSLAMTYR